MLLWGCDGRAASSLSATATRHGADGHAFSGDAPNKVENSYETWAMQLSRLLNVSDVMVEAISGYGVTPHSGRIQELYKSTLAFDASSPQWNFTKWVPDAVVMLIGPNDEAKRRGGFGAMLQPSLGKYDGKSFIAAYLELCEEVAKSYANAPNPPALVHVCGGSINGLDPCEDIQTASDKFNKKAVTRMRSYYTTITKAHWHEINKIGAATWDATRTMGQRAMRCLQLILRRS